MGDRHQNLSVGIIGGGQLALMLANAAIRMGLKPVILADNIAAPAAQNFSHVVLGSPDDPEVLKEFFAKVRWVVFENEFIDCEKLKASAGNTGIEFFPDLSVIARFQDK